ncbi:putative TPR repeat-containing protein [Nymphaea thermarum]|nr:putative TPR repeat-containing protein [Nymphaea thermarum]
MASRDRDDRSEKVRKIFEQFDANKDGGLDRMEMAALVIAVNPRVKFSDQQIQAILDEVFRTYGEFIDGDKGLTFEGLLRTYNDGAGDVDRDFDALNLDLGSSQSIVSAASSSSIVDAAAAATAADAPPNRRPGAPAWALSPNHGIVYDDTWKIIDDLDIVIKRLKVKQMKDGKIKGEIVGDAFSDPGWSRELGSESEGGGTKRVFWEESGPDYATFLKELRALRGKADGCRSREEAFDGHMAIGRTLYDHQLFKEALASFKRASELQPTDVRPHFRSGNSLYALGQFSEAKDEFLLALEAAESSGNQWSYLLPQIHVNLGIALEGEGLLLGACEHYREAAILSPTHYRALKLLGSALFGVGEYRAAEKALEEAVFLQPDYADAHCDLGSVLHAMGEDEKGIQEFQKAIDLRPGHLDALYNLGGLFMDVGRYQRASEMYGRVLAIYPNHWRAQLNKAISLLGAGETDEAKRALKEAFKMTNRVELYDAIAHLKLLQRKRKGNAAISSGGEGYIVVEASKFRRGSKKTTPRQDLEVAIGIRTFQRLTKVNRCEVDDLRKELNGTKVPVTYSGGGLPGKSIRKATLEGNLRKLLHFLKPEAFQGAMKAINERILAVLDESGSGRIDLGMFYAVLAPICAGPTEKRKRAAFDALVWRSIDEANTQLRKSDATAYIKYLRAVYVPSRGMSDMMEVHGEANDTTVISFSEFLEMFDDPDWGFGIMNTLVQLENIDRVRHGNHSCSICRYPIIGPRFKEMTSNFSLCSVCYSEGKVPSSCKQEVYRFKEYESEAEAMKDKFKLFNLHCKTSDDDP